MTEQPGDADQLDPLASGPRGAETRTFLIADIRGYTTFTREKGDEAAAALASRFAGIVADVVAKHEGFLVELRGDEALVVFVSARQALRAAVELQAQVRAEQLPRGIGIGLDAGEAIPVDGGFRGTALNLAARLCGQAGPGETLASEAVIHLAATVEGIAYVEPRSLRLKGFVEPVRAVDVVAADQVHTGVRPAVRRARRRVGSDRRLQAGITLVVVVALAVTGLQLGARRGPTEPASSRTPAAIASVAPSATADPLGAIQLPGVALVDPSSGSGQGVVAVTQPSELSTYADGAFWILGQTMNRIDPATHAVRSFPIPVDEPGRFTVSDGILWITDAESPLVVGFDTATGIEAHRYDLSKDPDDRAPASGVAVGAGSIWVSRPYGIAASGEEGGEVDRVDPSTGKIQARIALPGAEFLAFGDGQLWGGRFGKLTRIDPTTNAIAGVVDLTDGFLMDLIVAGGYAWASNGERGEVYKIDPARGAQTIKTGEGAGALASDGTTVWVTNYRAGTVTAIDVVTSQPVDLHVGHAPYAISAAPGSLMIAFDRSFEDFIAGAQGDVLTVAAHRDPFQDLAADPATGLSPTFRQVGSATCAPLLGYPDAPGPDGRQLRPEVATAMPTVSADGRTYTFGVAKGWRFSPPNGSDLTAATYKFSVERALSPDLGGFAPGRNILGDLVGADAYIAGTADHIDGIGVDGDRLSFTLVSPSGDFLDRLATPFFCPVPIGTPAHDRGLMADPPIAAAGPYYVKAMIQGADYLLARNPNYAGTRKGTFDTIAFDVSYGPEEVVSAVESGTVDAGVAYTDAVPLGPQGTIAAGWGPGSPAAAAGDQRWLGSARFESDLLILNPSNGLLRDVSIRRAIGLALDRPAIARVFNDAPSVRILPPAFRGGDVLASVPARDLDGARALMAGRTGKLVMAIYQGCRQCTESGQIVGSNLAAIGITVEVRPSGDPFGDAARPKSDIGLIEAFPQTDWQDPAALLAAIEPHGWVSGSGADDIDRLAPLSGDARVAAAADLATSLEDRAIVHPLGYPVYPMYLGKTVGCAFVQPANGAVDLLNLCRKP